MTSHNEHLEREASLMLYLADEMSPAEREAFDQRLAGDAALRAELEALAEAQVASLAALENADRTARLPTSQNVAVRRVARAIQQWQARRIKPAEPARRGLPLPWWCYPAAAAASIITAFLVWSSRQEVGPTPPAPGAHQLVVLDEEDLLADWLDSSLAFDETSTASADVILDVPFSSSRTDDLNSIFLTPPTSEETLQ